MTDIVTAIDEDNQPYTPSLGEIDLSVAGNIATIRTTLDPEVHKLANKLLDELDEGLEE